MFKPTLICTALLLAFNAPAHAAPAPKIAKASAADAALAARIDAVIAPYYSSAEPGAAVIVVKDGKTVFRKAYGLASMARAEPLDAAMAQRIGSVTKQFTAAAILLLAEEGKLKLDDDIATLLPGYPTHGERITVEHLLTHTSGIPSYSGKTGFNASRHLDASVDEVIATFKDDPLEFKPGTRWKYNNSGYYLLGAIIEKLSGKSYADFVRTRIFEPLAMRDTSVEGRARKPQRMADGHAEAQGKIVPSTPLSPSKSYAGGALVSTVDDLARWDAAVSAGKLLRADSWRRAFTPYLLADGKSTQYGYGWETVKLQGRDVLAHGGATNGFSSYVLRIPQDKLYVAVLSNAEYGVVQPDVVGSKAAAIAIGQPLPEFKAIAVEPKALQPFVGVYRASDGATRTVMLEDGQLWMLRAGRTRQRLLPHAENAFFLDRSLTHFAFGRDAAGKVVKLSTYQDGVEHVALRAEDTPAERRAIVLPEARLESYAGEYQLAPGFVLSVRRNGEQLSGQATGQKALDLLASADDVFFVKQIDAQVRFERDADGKVVRLSWKQGGKERPAPRLP